MSVLSFIQYGIVDLLYTMRTSHEQQKAFQKIATLSQMFNIAVNVKKQVGNFVIHIYTAQYSFV